MTVFIDYIFLENALYNLVIILQTAFLCRIKIRKPRICVASFVGSLYVCIMVWLGLDFLNYFWCKLTLSFVLVYISFEPKELGKYLKLVGTYYLATVINVGGCMVVNQMIVKDESINLVTKFVVYSIALALTYVYTKQFWKIYKNNLNSRTLIKEVTLNICGKKYIYNGFLDTGNTVKSYELGVPVIFAEYLDKEQRTKIQQLPKSSVSVSTISKQSQEDVVLIEKAKIGNAYVNVGVVFVESKLNRNNKYNMILNYELFEEDLGGIHI